MKFARPRRLVNRNATGPRRNRLRASVPLTLVAAVVVLGLATFAAVRELHPFYGWYYHWAWYPTLGALSAGFALLTGRWPATWRFAVSLMFWSAPLWFFFELINFRIANWYYVFAADSRAARVLGAFTAFATVLPAIYLAYRWAQRLGVARGWTGPALPLSRHAPWLVGAGLAILLLALWQPRFFFPLVWGSVTLVLEPWNYRYAPARSLLADLGHGRYERIVQILAAGAAVGLAWEAFNALAGARWIYTVPGLEGDKLFEMPLPGFLGFPVFALDCYVVYQALVNAGLAVPGWGTGVEEPSRGGGGRDRGTISTASRPGPFTGAYARAGCVVGAVAFGTAIAVGMERWTIDSTYPDLPSLPGITSTDVGSLRAAGVGSVEALARAEADLLSRSGVRADRTADLIATAKLTVLRGLGAANAGALAAAGMPKVCALAESDPAVVSRAVRAARTDPRAGSPPRVRVWIRSAARACRTN